ncbi:hypothetical protein GF412_00595 [Candidatus Micrarchaeota archaeon]|nr:hypothetical protein [Candidatus Micrarchaeota archaeon]MBD3417474.1 hypothetical protein [Candidatus Micrarchaeota archaeon]
MEKMERLTRLKERHSALEKRINSIGKEYFQESLRLSMELGELIEEIESTQEREKIPRNQVLSAKIKIVKYGIKLSKRLKYFEEEVVIQFDRGNITKEFGKSLISVTKRIKDNKMHLAKQEFRQFQGIIDLSREHDESSARLESEAKALRKEQYRIKELLKGLSWLDSQSVDLEKARRHEHYLEKLEELGKLREDYLHSLLSRPVSSLLAEAAPLKEHLPDFPSESEMAEMRQFFSAYPAIGESSLNKLCGMFSFSEKKLSHMCPETSRFRKTLLPHKAWFESMRTLDLSSFLVLEEGDEAMPGFYSEHVPGAQKIAEGLRIPPRERAAALQEYKKKQEIEKKRKELSAYSKEGLEKELEETESLLGFLESAPGPEEEPQGQNQGLLSRISSFFKT